MASNPTPDDENVLQALAEDIADGCHTHEVAIGVKQNTESVMRAAITGRVNARLTRGQKEQAVVEAVVEAAVEAVNTVAPGDPAAVGVDFDGMNVRFTFVCWSSRIVWRRGFVAKRCPECQTHARLTAAGGAASFLRRARAFRGPPGVA